jgi:CRISPR/Cas system CMR-associated protein Cmr1 (group 7 of RAMP superfamily)
MESIVIAVGLIAVVWYFGGVINSVVKGSGEMAGKEFDMLKDEQEVRIAKQYNDLGNRLNKVLEESAHTRGSVKEMIKQMNIANADDS